MGFFKKIVSVAAPIVAPVVKAAENTVSSVAKGDLAGAVKGAVSVAATQNTGAQVQQLTGMNIDGIPGFASGDFSKENIDRFAKGLLALGTAGMGAEVASAVSASKGDLSALKGYLPEGSEDYLSFVQNAMKSSRAPASATTALTAPTQNAPVGAYPTYKKSLSTPEMLILGGIGATALFVALRKKK